MGKDSDWSWAYEDEEDANSTISDERVWAGDDEPKLEKGNFSTCKACHGKDTIVIYHKSGANRDGLVVQEEHLCKDCGKYTQYYYDDRV